MRLTAVVPSASRWTHAHQVVEALLPAIRDNDVEILVVCGDTAAPPPTDQPNLRYIAIPHHDVFEARAVAAQHATGDIIALLEDHVRPNPDWASSLLAAWEQHPEADAIVHSIVVSPTAKMWEVALFTITFGPFMGITEVPLDRLPPPGIISFRRSSIHPTTNAVGWLEYDFLADLVAQGRVALATAPSATHIQPEAKGWAAARLSFHSGRMFSGTAASTRALTRANELRRWRRDRRVVRDQTFAARRRVNAPALGVRFVLCTRVLLAAHDLGQLVGIATRSPGASSSALE